MSDSFTVGMSVRVKNYPIPAHQSVPFSYNGLVGKIIARERIGSSWDNIPTYNYLVHFSKVQVPYSNLNPQTNRLDRGYMITDAENWFEDLFLEIVYHETPTPLVEQIPPVEPPK